MLGHVLGGGEEKVISQGDAEPGGRGQVRVGEWSQGATGGHWGRGTRIYAEVSSVEAKERCQSKADKIGAALELMLFHWPLPMRCSLQAQLTCFTSFNCITLVRYGDAKGRARGSS